jgi:hypothetical protein
MGQIPRSIWAEIVEWLKFAARLPVIGLVILTTAMFSWLGFWLVVRFTNFIFNRYLSRPW